MTFQGRPEGKGRGEVAEEEVGDGEGHDERVPGIDSHFWCAED